MSPKTKELLAEAIKEENHYMVEQGLSSDLFYDLEKLTKLLTQDKGAENISLKINCITAVAITSIISLLTWSLAYTNLLP